MKDISFNLPYTVSNTYLWCIHAGMGVVVVHLHNILVVRRHCSPGEKKLHISVLGLRAIRLDLKSLLSQGWQSSSDGNRYYNIILCKQTRQRSFSIIVQRGEASLGLVYRKRHSPSSDSCIRRTKYPCRLSEQVQLSNAWMVFKKHSGNTSSGGGGSC